MVSFSNILFVEPSELLKDHMVDPLARGFFFFFFCFFEKLKLKSYNAISNYFDHNTLDSR